MLRAAAIGGGAYVAGKKRSESQQREADEQARIADLESQQQAPAAYPPPPQPDAPAPTAAGLSPEAMAQLTQLGQLHEQGVLTDEEFATQKARLLGG